MNKILEQNFMIFYNKRSCAIMLDTSSHFCMILDINLQKIFLVTTQSEEHENLNGFKLNHKGNY